MKFLILFSLVIKNFYFCLIIIVSIIYFLIKFLKFNSLLTDNTPCNCQNQAISSTSTVSSIKIEPSLQTTTYKTNPYNQINGSPCKNTFRKTCLDMHNKYRAIHQGNF